jgi:hypothetical protein
MLRMPAICRQANRFQQPGEEFSCPAVAGLVRSGVPHAGHFMSPRLTFRGRFIGLCRRSPRNSRPAAIGQERSWIALPGSAQSAAQRALTCALPSASDNICAPLASTFFSFRIHIAPTV